MTGSTPSKDPWRWPVAALCLVLLLGLGQRFTTLVVTLPDGIRGCLADPAAHDGARLVLPVWFVSAVDGPDRYAVSRVVKNVPVEGDSTGLVPGQEITLVGRFRGQDGVIVEDHHQIHTLRPYKKWLSLLGLLLAAVLAPRAFVWRRDGLRPADGPVQGRGPSRGGDSA